MRRPRAARGRAGHREDGAGAHDRAHDRGRVDRAYPVHAGPAADGRHGPLGVRPADARLRVQTRADLRERRARRRGEPGDAKDAVGAARGDGRAPGDRGRDHAGAARPLPAARHREPDRVRGHLPAPGGPARPLLPEDRARLSGRRRRADDPRRAACRPSAGGPRAGREPRRHRRAPRRRAGRLRRRRPQALARRARAGDERARRRRHGCLGARQPRPRPRRTRVGSAPRSRVRRPPRRRAAVRARDLAPPGVPLRLPRPRPRQRLGGGDRRLPPAVPRAARPSPAPRRTRCSRVRTRPSGTTTGDFHSRSERAA